MALAGQRQMQPYHMPKFLLWNHQYLRTVMLALAAKLESLSTVKAIPIFWAAKTIPANLLADLQHS